MSSLVVEFRNHSYFYSCWWLLFRTWRFTLCPKNIVLKFLTNVLNCYISRPGRLRYYWKDKAATFSSKFVGVFFFILHFFKFVFKSLNLGFGELHIILSQTRISQPNWSALYLNLKDWYCAIVASNYYSLRQSFLALRIHTSSFL